jgi:tRNA U34 5-carboxymethylaminomethyl modifying enzyme MnmG/GidA
MFSLEWRYLLEQNPNVDFWQDMCVGIITEGDKVVGVQLAMGTKVYATTVVLTNGTFLNGLIHLGEKQYGGGRAGEKAAIGLTESLVEQKGLENAFRMYKVDVRGVIDGLAIPGLPTPMVGVHS